MVGMIFDIQRFCINDGPGIRTTVFMKGCPLKCVWCHNPESRSKNREMMFYKERCIHCGECIKRKNDKDFVCLNGAKEICGKMVKTDYIIEQVLKDKIFYENSDGGVTLSGGEPLFQYEFSLELLKKMKKYGLHTAVETCGYAVSENIRNIAEYTDLFLFDYKETNPQKHKYFTGVDNIKILENLSLLNDLNKKMVLRCPIVKGLNDTKQHLESIAEIADKYENILHVEIEPYHRLGETKNVAMGNVENNFVVATDEEKKEYIFSITKKTTKDVILA